MKAKNSARVVAVHRTTGPSLELTMLQRQQLERMHMARSHFILQSLFSSFGGRHSFCQLTFLRFNHGLKAQHANPESAVGVWVWVCVCVLCITGSMQGVHPTDLLDSTCFLALSPDYKELCPQQHCNADLFKVVPMPSSGVCTECRHPEVMMRC